MTKTVRSGLEFWFLVIDIYLKFGACDLRFD
jgi:hypothetical protein